MYYLFSCKESDQDFSCDGHGYVTISQVSVLVSVGCFSALGSFWLAFQTSLVCPPGIFLKHSFSKDSARPPDAFLMSFLQSRRILKFDLILF